MRRILVALDGSSRSDGVLAHAVSLARSTGAKLVLFRSYSVPPEMTLAWPESDERLETALRREAQTYLDARGRSVPSELFGEVRVALGPAWQSVCSAARDVNADLIVIGSHGYSGADHLLGTTAAKIVNHADRSVLVVRPPPDAP